MSENNKVEKALSGNKLNKYGATKKTFYSLGSMAVCILFIVVLSVTQASFDKDQITKASFWIDFIILAGLSIFGMISGQQSGDDVARNNPNGVFRKSLGKFGNIFSRLDSLMLFAYFDEWLEWYRERKLKKKIQSCLKDNGIHQMEVLDLDLSELKCLTEPYKKIWGDGSITYFLTYTEEQIDVIKYCKVGKVKVSKLPRSFFVDAFYQSEKDMWESAARSSKKKTTYLGANYAYRIIALLAMCILSAGLMPGATGASQATIWLSLVKRIFCVTTAFCWGVFIGYQIVKIDVSYLDFKIDVLTLYYQECEVNIYIPQTIDEKARKIYEENEVHKKKIEAVTDDGRSEGYSSGRREEGIINERA